MKRFLLLFALMAVVGLIVAFLFPAILPFRHMGRVESLHNQIALSGWSDVGLQTADGRTIPIPGIRNLPKDSMALAEATKRGVEIDASGRTICLVRMWHWCGNDPITADILRVDLSDMLTFLQVGEPTSAIGDPEFLAHTPGGSFYPDSGWNISDYIRFQMWQREKEMEPLFTPSSVPATSTGTDGTTPH